MNGMYGRLIGLWCTRRLMGVPVACGPVVGMYYMAIGLQGTSRPEEAVRRSRRLVRDLGHHHGWW